jgi:hypothetical protein
MKKQPSLLLILCCCAASLACSSNSPGTSTGASGTTGSGSTTSGTTSHSTTSGTTSASSTTSGGSGATYQGVVAFGSLVDPTGVNPTEYTADALFAPSATNLFALYAVGCTYVAGAGTTLAQSLSAGTINLNDGQTNLGQLAYDSNTGYYLDNLTAWNPADSLSASAAGDVVTAFNGQTTAPAVLQNVAVGGTPLSSSEVTVSVGGGLTVTWNGASANLVQVELNANNGSVQVGTIYCNAADSAGTLNIPASQLVNFSVGQSGTLTISRINYATASASDASVYVAALNFEQAPVTYGQ